MKKRRKIKRVFHVLILLMILSAGISFSSLAKVDVKEFFFTLETGYFSKYELSVNAGDYLNLLKNQLAQIGINLDITVWDYPPYYPLKLFCWGRDLFFLSLIPFENEVDPNFFTEVYGENGSLNVFRYDESLDWDSTLVLDGRTGWGKNEWYLKKGALIMPPNSEERIAHYWEWENYLMDKILPCQPIFTRKQYVCLWNNLQGYNLTDGLLKSWGKMSWQDTHTGQLNNSEIVIADNSWSNLNPLFQDDKASKFVSNAILDPLIWYDPDTSIWPHLAKSYTMINDTYVRIETREGIKWHDPGGFPNEFFDVFDVYFTLYSWVTFSNYNRICWIKDMKIVDNQTLDIFIDFDKSTPENDSDASFLVDLSANILPEHYLNQTQLIDGKTPNITHSSWTAFKTNPFGTGLFEMHNYVEGVETTLKLRSNCWWLDDSITSDSKLNWINIFGDFNSEIEQLRIRIIGDVLSQFAEFEAGKLDLIDVSNYPYKKAEYLIDPTKVLQSKILPYFNFIMYNLGTTRTIIGSSEPCELRPDISKGLAIRKAISYAINRNDLNNIIHGGDFVFTDYPIYPTLGFWCNPNIIRYDHNLEKAKEYMALAGYRSVEPTQTSPNIRLVISFLTIFILDIMLKLVTKGKKK